MQAYRLARFYPLKKTLSAHNRSLLLIRYPFDRALFSAWLLLLKAFDCVMSNITVLSPRTKDKERRHLLTHSTLHAFLSLS
jgi:hypothetical protein